MTNVSRKELEEEEDSFLVSFGEKTGHDQKMLTDASLPMPTMR